MDHNKETTESALGEGAGPSATILTKLTSFWKVAALVVPPFLLFYGCLSLHGFWSSFDVDFWEFISIGEVIKRSLFDVITGIGMMMFMVLCYMIIYFKPIRIWLDKIEARQKEKQKNQKLGKFAHWAKENQELVLFLGFLSAIPLLVLYIILFEGISDKDFPLIVLIAITLMGTPVLYIFILSARKTIKKEMALATAILVAFSPTISLTAGSGRAMRITNPENKNKPEYRFSFREEAGSKWFRDGIENYDYIDRMGGFYFFRSKKYVSTVIIPEQEVVLFERWEKKDSYPNFGPFLSIPELAPATKDIKSQNEADSR